MPNGIFGLLWVFLPISIVTIGGGQSAIAEIQHQVVAVHHWMTPQEFVDIFAISRMAPGPGSLIATLIGWHVAGLAGAVVATLALFVPTSIIIYGVAHVWSRQRGARWQVALETGLRPVAAGMILAAVLVLIESMDGGVLARIICLASAAAMMLSRVNAALLLLAGALVFALGHSVIS